jgi:Ser/Thr protein kinase RdoA (MazF antagonist)
MKLYKDRKQLEKSIYLTDFVKGRVLATEFMADADGKRYYQIDNEYYAFMRKIGGKHLEPFDGDVYQNGKLLGGVVAELHAVLAEIGDGFVCHDALFEKSMAYITKNTEKGGIIFKREIIDYIREFGGFYDTLPRQVIHRDVHLNNMLFDGGTFAGWLDFDIAERNARVFDVCYLGASAIYEIYNNEGKFEEWRKLFRGIIDGYNVLTPQELAAIPLLFVFIEMIFTAFYAAMGWAEDAAKCQKCAEWFYDNKQRIA